ncbi:putative membrane protein [Stella humosa]|uniref:Protoporphyrinogen IX oxidase n=1 Tax=Stella humosa TaxID=94 RepID=A0A3N1LHF9_9PROT|nr:protoporphyrinogen oxidase HemJ [Stella humosa]ROP90957.1 putative membrane protein [Stella humosa]BBK34693.1 membrane protein [Stella humosa]
MSAVLAALYPWTKALHIIAVISWMAGLLYLPRLFVYHCAAERGSSSSETFKVMERRLLRAIMNPAMIAAYVFGLSLLLTPGIVDWQSGWIYAKLGLVAVLTWHHHRQASWMKEFAADRNERPARFFRMQNEVPTLLMIVIVIMVVVRPF